ncbi:50S rRNA methyltransferase [Achromatium sp. WMS2]|nr:50S rRNA methyltransferase [Achromatium sp. WMS2]
MAEAPSKPPFASPAIPAMLNGSSRIQFNCYPGIACFNACCKRADITLTPYDILKLKQHFNMGSEAFLKQYTVPFQMDADGIPGVKMRTNDDGACLLLDPEHGCTVYPNRPIVCRYYPLALLNIREQDSSNPKEAFSLVKEEHCQGHQEAREISIDEYRVEQGCADYDQYNREWYRLILKKKSAGPGVGKPSELSLQMFFMASYNLDMFRRFVISDSFQRNYQLPDSFYQSITQDDLALLEFALKFLRQVLFGERTIEEVKDAWEKRLEERTKIWEIRTQAAVQAKAQTESAELAADPTPNSDT